MDFDEVVVKESPGLCRCCLSEGCYKELGTEYSWMSETEIYADMLLECFDVSISQQMEGPNGPNRLICEVCITRLRDACNFKKQVLESEKKFIDMVAKGEFRTKVMLYEQDNMKEEPQIVQADALEVEYLDELDFGDDAEDLLKDDDTDHTQTEDITVAPLPVKRGRGRPRKNPISVKPEKKSKIAKLEEKPRSSKSSNKEGHIESASTRRRRNLVNIFNNTSLVPFKWRGKYICYFCNEKFTDPKLMRKHSKAHGNVSILDKSLKCQRKATIEVKLDVSEITCEICNENFDSFDEIVHHLSFKHNLVYDAEVASPIESYRLYDLKCLVCGRIARNFINLVTHMNNNHPKNHYPCEHCGQQFNKMRDLDTHKRNFHREGGYTCEKCLKNFTSFQRLKLHVRKAHMSSCDICFKQFSTIEIKNKHMTAAHVGLKSEYRVDDILDESDLLEANHQDLFQRKQKGLRNRANISCVLNMSTAIPFKYFKNQYLCFYCSKYFTDCDLLKEHTVTSHIAYNTEQKCTKALKGSDVCIKIDISNLACKVCYESIDNLDNLIDHLIEKHNAKYDKSISGIMQPFRLARDNMSCPVCNLDNFNYFGTLLRHMNKNHTVQNFICDNCGEAFGSSLLLKSHLNRLHSDKEFKCDVCFAVFNNLVKLESHRAKTHGVKCINCSKCPESFLSDYAKRKHLMRVHNIGHQCTYCDRMFTKNSFMRSHIKRTHLKEKNVACPVCHVKFFDNYILRQHMVKHIGDKNFHCDVCGKSFYWKKNLRGHMASHSKHTQNVDVQF